MLLRRAGSTAGRVEGDCLWLCLKPNITSLKTTATQARWMLSGRTAGGVVVSGILLNAWHKTGEADRKNPFKC